MNIQLSILSLSKMRKNDGKVKITIYEWAGKKGPFKITSPCKECDIGIPLVKDIIKRVDGDRGKVRVEVKPWLDNFFEALWKGGWHAPIILVNGKIFSQGIVPDANKLKDTIVRELRK